GAAQRAVAAGDDALDHGRRRHEGGRAFGGVEHAETAAGACADVEKASACSPGGGDAANGVDDAGFGAVYSGGDLAGLGVDDVESVRGGELVEAARSRQATFGEEVAAVVHGVNGSGNATKR